MLFTRLRIPQGNLTLNHNTEPPLYQTRKRQLYLYLLQINNTLLLTEFYACKINCSKYLAYVVFEFIIVGPVCWIQYYGTVIVIYQSNSTQEIFLNLVAGIILCWNIITKQFVSISVITPCSQLFNFVLTHVIFSHKQLWIVSSLAISLINVFFHMYYKIFMFPTNWFLGVFGGQG